MNRQKSLDILQYNQQQVMRNIEKKRLDKQRQQQEDQIYIEKINNDLNQERHSQIMRKQNLIEQSQRNYTGYQSSKVLKNIDGSMIPNEETYKHRNSKLKEINTFKIGGENREIKKKNYHEYNDNLNTNPTRHDPRSLVSNVYYNEKITPSQTGNYNIINNENKKNHDNSLLFTSSEQRQAMNKENFDIYGRRVGNNDVFEGKKTEGEIKGIDNLENYSVYNDYHNYKPGQSQSQIQKNEYKPTINTGYVYDKSNNEKNQFKPSQVNQKQKVDLNSIPIPDYIKTVEDYEKYLGSQEYKYEEKNQDEDEVNVVANQISNMKIGNDSNIRSNFKNQSQILIGDQSNNIKKNEEIKKDYVPIKKNKNISGNPCK